MPPPDETHQGVEIVDILVVVGGWQWEEAVVGIWKRTRVKSILGQVGMVLHGYSLLFSIIRMPVPFFLCVLLKMFNKSLRE